MTTKAKRPPLWTERDGYPPILQNKNSRHKTPASLRFDLHYAKIGVIARWDWSRYIRLATFLTLTPTELASLICMPHAHLDSAERNNRFAGPACLLLTLLEAQAMANYTNDVLANPFPAHPHGSPQAEAKVQAH